jgi:hypothetical protein
VNAAFSKFRRLSRRAAAGFLWLFAPVATSVKGALDRTDWRPIAAKLVVLASAAGVGIKAALKDPEVMGALAVVGIAVISGALEAVSRASLGAATEAVPSQSPTAGAKAGGPNPDAPQRPA